MTTINHFRPHSEFLAELEALNAKQAARKHRKLFVGDRVIVPGGWDGTVDYIDSNGIDVCVNLDNGPVRGLTSFLISELEFWSHGR